MYKNTRDIHNETYASISRSVSLCLILNKFKFLNPLFLIRKFGLSETHELVGYF